jgi:hypothetical protein
MTLPFVVNQDRGRGRTVVDFERDPYALQVLRRGRDLRKNNFAFPRGGNL